MFTGLTSLPPFSPASALRELDARNCALKSLPDNLLDCHLEVDLRGKKTGEWMGYSA